MRRTTKDENSSPLKFPGSNDVTPLVGMNLNIGRVQEAGTADSRDQGKGRNHLNDKISNNTKSRQWMFRSMCVERAKFGTYAGNQGIGGGFLQPRVLEAELFLTGGVNGGRRSESVLSHAVKRDS